ncbi:MAG: type II toxin-antitoxin system HicB family antitoxin [Endomicrobia bacterium]|nr:type II toxin-antitoxin system HicB family antitoxin [Endomicrobiia bacterium]
MSKKNISISVSVPVYFFKHNGDKYIYAECPSLRIITHANTLAKAKRRFDEAFKLWLEVAVEDGIRKDLKALGWKVTPTEVTPRDEFRKIPLEILASTTVHIRIPPAA